MNIELIILSVCKIDPGGGGGTTFYGELDYSVCFFFWGGGWGAAGLIIGNWGAYAKYLSELRKNSRYLGISEHYFSGAREYHSFGGGGGGV